MDSLRNHSVLELPPYSLLTIHLTNGRCLLAVNSYFRGFEEPSK